MSTLDHIDSVAKPAQKENIIKKSKFLCYVNPTSTVEEAQAFVEYISKRHWDANHNVWAWRVGSSATPLERFSDDGEPTGTAGMPVLEVLRKKHLTNCVVVVTRYFGGILLGAGGVVRAYTESAVRGITEAGVTRYVRYRRFSVILSYPLLGTVMNLFAELDAKVEAPDFGAEVLVKGWAIADQVITLEKRIAELGQGQLGIDWAEEAFLPRP